MDFQKAVELINNSSRVLLTTHTKPDGDACGCMAALAEAFEALDKTTTNLLLSELPEWYEFLFDQKPQIFDADLKANDLADCDLIVLVDVNSANQLPKFADFLKQTDEKVLVFDHHVTNDGLGDVELVDTDAAATALVIYDFLKFAGWRITEKIAGALFVGTATDTGWFRFSNTDSRCFKVAAELIEAGADSASLHHRLYQNFSAQRFRLMTTMFGTLELHFDGRYATQQLTQKDFERTGATHKDTENLIDECRRIRTVEVAALFVELKDGRIRLSLRSTGKVDVREIAQKFGGGGHDVAAGAHLPGPIERAKQSVLELVAEQCRKLATQN